MSADWNSLPDDLQLILSQEAMRRAADAIATQAEMLAGEMETGGLCDRGGPDALRLFAAVIRATGPHSPQVAGHA